MVVRIPVNPRLIDWAVDRSGLEPTALDRRFPKLPEWQSGHLAPTFNQLQDFANATHAPLGFLFLQEPPDEPMPIPDYRTLGNESVGRPSPDLLDTIYLCQLRQDWYRDHASEEGTAPLAFVGSCNHSSPITPVADEIRRAINFGLEDRAVFSNWESALRKLIDSIEDLGVLVMVSGIVGTNTHRKLEPKEFRGFALTDSVAPLIFVNGSDTKAAQIFTLIHELAHIWAGETALSDARMGTAISNEGELWANRVAAEVLIPLVSIRQEYKQSVEIAELERLAKRYRVSTLVVLKRIHDAGFLEWDDFQSVYESEHARVVAIMKARQEGGSGGNYYYTQPLRISRHFARAVIVDALEGRTLYRDAYRLLGMARHETFSHMATELGVG